MKCEDARTRLSAFVDREDVSDELRAHVESCAECAGRVKKIRAADALLGEAAKKMAPPVRGKTERFVKAAMSAPRTSWLRRIASVAAAFLVAIGAVALFVNTRTAPPLTVTLHARPEATAGAPARLMFLVRNHQTGAPVPGAHVVARAGDETIEADADAQGVVNISFTPPETADDLRVTADVTSAVGSEQLSHKFTVVRPHKLLITTDKPLYQPTQVVHMRVLGMNTLTHRPIAGKDLQVEMFDPNGNKIFRKAVKSSDFGTAGFDFRLADELAFGHYRIRASVGGVTSERTFRVDRYVLPKFKIEVALNRTWYMPNERVKGEVRATYFQGQPVANARVSVNDTAGTTDALGRFSFERPAGELRITVTDGAEHTETKTVAVTVSHEPLLVWALPEGGVFVPGVENRVFVITATPDGALAKATIAVGDREISSDGISEFATTDANVRVMARDEKGATGSASLVRDGGTRSFHVRPDAYRVRAGQPLGLTALAGFPDGTLYVDVVREGATFVTKTIDVRGGKGQTVVDLPAELAGTVRVSAYRIKPDGDVERDSRTILVEPAAGLVVDARPAREKFAPGEEMPIEIRVRDAKGNPQVAELALAIVDEAVFALHESRPGLEKVFFWIQEQLLTPRWQLKGCAPLGATPAAVANDDVLARLRGGLVAPQDERPAMERGFVLRQADLDRYAAAFNRGLGMVAAWGAALGFICALIGASVLAARTRSYGLIAVASALWLGIGFFIVNMMFFVAGRADMAMVGSAPGGRDSKFDLPERGEARIRQDFPETLYWNACIITDDNGRATITVPGADSVTEWRLTASAVTRTGGIGATDRGIFVFQDFFVDLDLPVSLTQGDAISVPVACYNYLKAPQDVTVRLALGDGFEATEQLEKTVRLEPNEVRAVYFRVRATRFGLHAITAFAKSATAEDAIRRTIEVLPDGQPTMVSQSDAVRGRTTMKLRVPAESIDGATQMWVRLFPSRLSEAVTGLERMVQMPYG